MPTTNGREQVFNEGIKNNDARPADTTANFLVTLNPDGTQGKIDPADLPASSSSISKKTISEIRALSGTLSNNNFYTTDIGKEGNWYYDSTDTTTADNTGTVLVTADGKRIKRIFNDFVNITWFGAIGDNTTDNTTFIQSALNANGKVLIPKGTFISSNLTLNSKNTLLGTGESSIIKFKSGSTGYFLNGDTRDGILITEVLIDGGNITNYSSTATIGTRSGIYLNAVNQNNKVYKCKITGFNAIALGYNGTGASINESVSTTDCNISYNYCGISTAPSGVTHDTGVSGGAGGEYSKIIGCTLNANRYAVVNSAGNTNVTGNNMSGNGYGIYSTSVGNVGHGNVVSNLINHSAVYGIYMQSNIQSAVISNNAFFYGDIYFDLSNGILFTGNQLAVTNITLLGGGYHNFSNNYYYVNPTFTGDLTGSIFSNNFALGGATTTTVGTGGFINNTSLVTDSAIKYDNTYNIANNIVTNGDFAVDASWTKGAGWTISGGKANSTTTSNLSQTMSFINGAYYVVEFDISNFTSGLIRAGIGGGSLSSYISGNGHKKLLIQKPLSGGDSNFYLASQSFIGSVDNVVIYESLSKKLTVDNGIIVSSETANTIASFDGTKQLKSLPLATYPSLTELAYVKGVASAIQTQIDSKAPTASPTLTGTPTAPTATAGTNTTQLATTAFVQAAVTNSSADIQDIVNETIKTGTIDGGNSYIELLEGTTDDRRFEVTTANGSSATSTLKANNTQAVLLNESSTAAGGVLVAAGIVTMSQTNVGSGTTYLGFNPAATTTNVNFPANSVSGSYLVQMQPKEYTVSTLPTPTGSDSRFEIVTDALSPTYLGVLTGGGTVTCPAFHDGTDWVAH